MSHVIYALDDVFGGINRTVGLLIKEYENRSCENYDWSTLVIRGVGGVFCVCCFVFCFCFLVRANAYYVFIF